MGAGCCKEEPIDFSAEIELSHFHLLRSVGKGAFGKVRVVQHKKTKEIYALKYINKAKCIRMRAVENIIQERRLLEEVEFSLICNLRYAFQDDENLFMVLDLMLGGDLRFHLERAGPMREDVVRFYVAEIALALDALHAKRIIHRDLKPDNVLLDEHGHAHLTDFNIAVYYNPSKPLMSIAGSMAYMAPEILKRTGYLESVDWWSLGVVMFELLFGKRPFRGKTNELLTNSILKDPLPLPDNARDIVSKPCLDVLAKLCERDISKRMGCTAEGLNAFKKHAWFKGIDWDLLAKKEATPPFEPDSKRANFDATHELEELLMEDNPLKAKKRAQTSPDTELSSEMQMMEDKFIVYDFTKVKSKRSLSMSRRGSSTLSGSKSGGLARSVAATSSKSSLSPNTATTTTNTAAAALAAASASQGLHNGPTGILAQKLNRSSVTLESILMKAVPSSSSRTSLGRIENHFHVPSVSSTALARTPSISGTAAPNGTTAPGKIYRPNSPSDLVGQKRFNPDVDRLSLISLSDIPHTSYFTATSNDGKDSNSDESSISDYKYKMSNSADESEANSPGFLQAGPMPSSTNSAQMSQQRGPEHSSSTAAPLTFHFSPSSSSSSSLSSTSEDQDGTRRGHNHHRDISSAISTPPTTHHSSPMPVKLEGGFVKGTVLFPTTEIETSNFVTHTSNNGNHKTGASNGANTSAELETDHIDGQTPAATGIKVATAVGGSNALTVALHLGDAKTRI
ncbi:serine/threonine kinase 32 [Entomortierella parvispora]|uniref:Serine/threonine kinase 32 n=1 Tax=Entomortierella parvispora TaxID=205924 RepID=A0A9P3HC48_9FUNG|nr:serine/threonine kinase 32 [Entomortierella parvispora]